MTTLTATATTITPPGPREPRAGGRRVLAYLWSTLRMALTDWAFLGFIIAMPSAMYLFFGTLYGADDMGGMDYKQHVLVMMATYGAMGSALAAGATIQVERATGWFRQLMLTALTPAEFFGTRMLGALLVVVPPVVVVLMVGALTGVRLQPETWLAIVGVSLLVLLPFVMMGLVAGLWLKPSAAGGATTFLMLAMAMLGGMWVPLEQMPEVLQGIGRMLPSYWAARFTLLPVVGGPVPVRGVVTLLAWILGMAVLGVVGYRRAISHSRR